MGNFLSTVNSNLNNIFTYSSAKATNVAISSGNVMCYRDGKTVNLSGLFQVSKSGNVATIPASYRPKGVIVCSIIKDGGVGCRAHIESDGTINPQNQLETGVWYTLSTAYVI